MKESAGDTIRPDCFFVLMAAVFTVALGYGIVLPVLPFLLAGLVDASDAASIAWHTGMLSGVYMFALFVFAPLWGRVSDRIGRRPVILLGLTGYVVALAIFGLSTSLWLTYGVRALAGAFVSAVLPVTQAYISETSSEGWRTRRFAWMGAASLAGFLLGPALSGWVYGVGKALQPVGSMGDGMIMLPLYISALLGLPVLAGAYLRLPEVAAARPQVAKQDAAGAVMPFYVLLVLNLLVTFGLGSFEVSIALQGQQTLGLDPSKVGIMFMECSLVMILVQAVIFFSPALERLRNSQILMAGFASMAVGFLFLPGVRNFYVLLLLVGLIAAGSGLLLPTLTALVSMPAQSGLGRRLGLQTAVASLGQAIGSVAGGWLFGLVGGATFWLTTVLMVIGVLVGFFGNGPALQKATDAGA